jgi:hypothetical protein
MPKFGMGDSEEIMRLRRFLSKAAYKMLSVNEVNQERYFKASSDDAYLVSYPRSGNTWVRVIVSELLYGESGSSLEDLQFYVPDLYVKTKIGDVIEANRHVVKTHKANINGYQRFNHVIYIIRDPRDIVLSYYRYRTKLYNYEFDLNQFIFDWVNGRIWPCSWREHVNSWTKAVEKWGQDLLLIRYEDLVENPEAEIFQIAEFFNRILQQSDVKRIVNSSSVEVMRLKEKRGLPEHESHGEFNFIGPAVSKQWPSQLTKKQAAYIEHNYRDIMLKFGYLAAL